MRSLVCVRTLVLVLHSFLACYACEHALLKHSNLVFNHHVGAVFLSAVEVENGFVGFYRTRYDSYDCGAMVMDKQLRLMLDVGHVIHRCEDPRAFTLGADVYVVDNHGGHPRRWIHLSSGRETIVRMKWVHGKNWTPLVHEDQLYFIYKFHPLCILRCDVRSGHCENLTPCDETIPGWRGGTNAVVRGDTVFGFGHYTHTSDYHQPFFWSFPTFLLLGTDHPVFANKTLTPHTFDGVHDPSALLSVSGVMYLGMTESPSSWFREQEYNLTWYTVQPCWLAARGVVT